MRKNELIKQLNSLQQKIKPDGKWLENNRDILLSQLKAQTNFDLAESQRHGLKFVKNIFAFAYKPAVSMAVVFVLVFGSWIATVSATKNSLPGDFLYNLKLTTERVQVNLAMDEEKKTNLELEFAGRRLQEIKTVVANAETTPQQKGNLDVTLKKFQESMVNLKTNLAKLEIKDKDKAVEIASVLDQKSQEYVDILQDQQESLPELAQNTEDAINASKGTSEKALDLIIKEFEAGQSNMQPDDIINKVSARIDDLEKVITQAKSDLQTININQIVLNKQLEENAKAKQAAEAEAAQTEANSAEPTDQAAAAEETVPADNTAVPADNTAVPADNSENTNTQAETPACLGSQCQAPTAEVLPTLEEIQTKPDEAYALLQQARTGLRNVALGKAFALVKQADDIMTLVNKVINANAKYLDIESLLKEANQPQAEEQQPANNDSQATDAQQSIDSATAEENAG